MIDYDGMEEKLSAALARMVNEHYEKNRHPRITATEMQEQPAGRGIVMLNATQSGKAFVTYHNTTAGSAAERMAAKESGGYELIWRVQWAEEEE